MKYGWNSVASLFKNIYFSIFRNGFNLLISQGIFVGLVVYGLTPFINYVLELALALSGYSYITTNNFGKFLLYPFTIAMIILLFLILGILFLYEGVFLLTYFSFQKREEDVKIWSVFLLSFRTIKNLIIERKVILLPYVWSVTMVFNIPLIVYIVKKIRYLRIGFETIQKDNARIAVLLTIAVLFIVLIVKNIYAYVVRIIRKSKLQETREYLRNIDDSEKRYTVIYFLLWNLILSIISYLVYFLSQFIAAIISLLLARKELEMATFLAINDKMSMFLGGLIFIISMVGNYSLISNLIFKYGMIDYRMGGFYIEDIKGINYSKLHIRVASKVVSYKKIVITLVMLFIISNSIFIYAINQNGSVINYVGLDSIKITSHRGFSKNVPENTLLALERAVEENADYVEVDVRQTKDGELVILHDESLKRTTGMNKKIWQVTLAEVKKLDSGRWFSEEYEGLEIPTLREVFEYTKGKVNLNLDLKYNKNYIGFEEAVVQLIEEYDMELQSNISSTKLSVLSNVKKLNDTIKTGYIIYQIDDSYYDLEEIDFFSVNSYFVTEKLLFYAHNAGKEVHAWTVNGRNEFERLNRIGVDNIITDNPSYAKIVLFEAESDPIIISMLKSILRY